MSSSGIYGLTDEDAGEIRYVGRALDIGKRYRQHLAEGRKTVWAALSRGWLESPVMRTKLNWLAYMGLEGKPVGLVLLESVGPDRSEQEEREHAWARTLSELDFPLANGTTAGTHLGSYMSKGTCPYTPGLPMGSAFNIESPDGLMRVRPGYPVIPVMELPALRRLRKDAPELHAEVIEGRLSAHAAMLKAGFRKRTISVRLDEPASAAKALRKHMPPEQLRALVRLLAQEGEPS